MSNVSTKFKFLKSIQNKEEAMKLKLELTNCYGINQLNKEFDFTKTHNNDGVHCLYAANGTLKTSLAKSFKDIELERTTRDLIFTDRITNRSIKIDNIDIVKEQVLVIDSYNESYSSKQISSLLVNDALKQQYEAALKEVDDKRSNLQKALIKTSGKRDPFNILFDAFERPENTLLELLTELHEIEHPDLTNYAEFKYGDLFNPKVIELISSKDFNKELTEYVDTYEKLINESSVLSKTFNHQKAGVVSKTLNENGFFSTEHSINISVRGEKKEIKTKEELNDLLQVEQEKVLQDPELNKKFLKVDGKLKTKDTQVFRDFIAEHKELLPEYQNLQTFKKNVFLGYLQSQQFIWDELVNTYKQNQELVANIIHQAQEEKTTWETVVNTFNRRFKVPFKLSVGNQGEVILNGAAPAIKFEFDDGRGAKKEVSQVGLVEALSQGEKRALYILNVLFEIEVRMNHLEPILIVIDDIADSFDYKNKYAIVEYLKDIAKVNHFNILLLTHNFDFHRIISSRLGVKRQNRHIAAKSDVEIVIKKEKYQKDVFKTWKQEFSTNESYMIASIPFARNIAEYCGNEAYFDRLTSLLHLKPDTKDIKVIDIQNLYRDIFSDQADLVLPDNQAFVLDKIFQQCDALLDANEESPELENKVILAIGIRLRAELFMIEKIAEPLFVEAITSNQTRELYEKLVNKYPEDLEVISLMDQVNLMTPENIHLNSFMYEPILDMSAHSLYKLYGDIKLL